MTNPGLGLVVRHANQLRKIAFWFQIKNNIQIANDKIINILITFVIYCPILMQFSETFTI